MIARRSNVTDILEVCESPQTHVTPGSFEKLVLYSECRCQMVPHCETLFGSDYVHDTCGSVSDKVGGKIRTTYPGVDPLDQSK